MPASLLNTQRLQLNTWVQQPDRGNHGSRYHTGGAMPSQRMRITECPLAVAIRNTTAEPPSGDRRQAEYYLRLLTSKLSRIDRRIGICRDGITLSESAADVENVLGFRRLLRIELQDRQTVGAMIVGLQRRFALPVAAPIEQSNPRTPRRRG